MITSEAMIVICTMMRMLFGMRVAQRRDHGAGAGVTAVSAIAHQRAPVAATSVTASAEQMPRICNVMGLLLKRLQQDLPGCAHRLNLCLSTRAGD